MELENGTAFPEVMARAGDEGEVSVASRVAGSWGVVLFYRGHW